MCFGCKLSTLAAESLKDNPDPPRMNRTLVSLAGFILSQAPISEIDRLREAQHLCAVFLQAALAEKAPRVELQVISRGGKTKH